MTYIGGHADTLMADCIEVAPGPEPSRWQDRVAPSACTHGFELT